MFSSKIKFWYFLNYLYLRNCYFLRWIKKHYRFILTTRGAVRRTIKEFKLIDMSRYKYKHKYWHISPENRCRDGRQNVIYKGWNKRVCLVRQKDDEFKNIFISVQMYTLMLNGPMLETLDYTICICSTPTILYFDLPTQDTTFIYINKVDFCWCFWDNTLWVL